MLTKKKPLNFEQSGLEITFLAFSLKNREATCKCFKSLTCPDLKENPIDFSEVYLLNLFATNLVMKKL